VVGGSKLRVGKRKQKFRPLKEVCAPKAESQSTRCGGRCTTTCMGFEAFTELKYPMDYSSCILVHCTYLDAAEIMMHLTRFSPHLPGHLDGPPPQWKRPLPPGGKISRHRWKVEGSNKAIVKSTTFPTRRSLDGLTAAVAGSTSACYQLASQLYILQGKTRGTWTGRSTLDSEVIVTIIKSPKRNQRTREIDTSGG
jgi:hypothetical protein